MGWFLITRERKLFRQLRSPDVALPFEFVAAVVWVGQQLDGHALVDPFQSVELLDIRLIEDDGDAVDLPDLWRGSGAGVTGEGDAASLLTPTLTLTLTASWPGSGMTLAKEGSARLETLRLKARR